MVTDRFYLDNRKQIEELNIEIKKLKHRIKQLESELQESNRQAEVNFGRSY